jgi:HAD superfamily hydrolase (TIGR01509 family)
MIKLVLFDLDGVLINSKKIHYDAMNVALPPQYQITYEEHLNLYDGLKTTEKLEMLTKEKGLPLSEHKTIYNAKQQATMSLLSNLEPNEKIRELFCTLNTLGYTIGVCSNSIRRTVLTTLAQTDLIKYCSVIMSNEDVKNGKPHPEMYWKAMSVLGHLPEETIIIEDSPPGLLAAERSRANYIRVKDPTEVTCENILDRIKGESKVSKWKDDKLNVLIPMAGAGSRFEQAGYTFPKPLIPVNGKPMIQVVVDNLGVDANFHFVVQKSHREKYNLDTMLNLIAPGCKVIEVDGITEGAACTALLAKEFIDNEQPLLFANSDQFCEWKPVDFMYNMQEKNCDGGIVTFENTHPKWSYARIDDNGLITEVQEKNPISKDATVGYYYWKHGSDFVKYAEQMIERDIRVNNEFYVCPVFNQAIEDGKSIRAFRSEGMWGLGTPEDLEYFVANYKEKV